MIGDSKRFMDEELQKDLSGIIQKVNSFTEEKDSVLLSLLRQKRLPELYDSSNN